MKTGLTRKQKVTEFYFNEHDDPAEIYTHNTDLKKRLLAYAKEYPELCQLTEDDEQGGLRFEIDKHRIGIRLTAPYSPERRLASSKIAKEIGMFAATENRLYRFFVAYILTSHSKVLFAIFVSHSS